MIKILENEVIPYYIIYEFRQNLLDTFVKSEKDFFVKIKNEYSKLFFEKIEELFEEYYPGLWDFCKQENNELFVFNSYVISCYTCYKNSTHFINGFDIKIKVPYIKDLFNFIQPVVKGPIYSNMQKEIDDFLKNNLYSKYEELYNIKKDDVITIKFMKDNESEHFEDIFNRFFLHHYKIERKDLKKEIVVIIPEEESLDELKNILNSYKKV